MTEHAPVDTGIQHGPHLHTEEKMVDAEKQKERQAAAKEMIDVEVQIKQVTDRMAVILKKYGGQVENVPLSGEFWALRNQLQQLTESQKYMLESLEKEKATAKDKIEAEEKAKMEAEVRKREGELDRKLHPEHLPAKPGEPAKPEHLPAHPIAGPPPVLKPEHPILKPGEPPHLPEPKK